MAVGNAPFHAHVYYGPSERAVAQSVRAQLANREEILFVGRMADGPVGPHPIPQFEVHFDASGQPIVEALLRAAGLRALIHPLTDDDLADHTALATWIGEPLALDVSSLDPPGMNQGVARFGKSDF